MSFLQAVVKIISILKSVGRTATPVILNMIVHKFPTQLMSLLSHAKERETYSKDFYSLGTQLKTRGAVKPQSVAVYGCDHVF